MDLHDTIYLVVFSFSLLNNISRAAQFYADERRHSILWSCDMRKQIFTTEPVNQNHRGRLLLPFFTVIEVEFQCSDGITVFEFVT
jgi:hypothetical protein